MFVLNIKTTLSYVDTYPSGLVGEIAINEGAFPKNSLLRMVVIEDKSLVFSTLISPFSSATYVFAPSGVRARAKDPISKVAEVKIEIGFVVKSSEKMFFSGG